MLDLGLHSREEHLAVGKDVVRAEVDHLITVGENAALIGQAAAEEGMNAKRITNTRSYNEAASELDKNHEPWGCGAVQGLTLVST